MKQFSMRAPWIKEYHWEDLANLHVELRFVRHRLILALNQKTAEEGPQSLELLDQLAKVDDLLAEAGDTLEKAKRVLFTICYDRSTAKQRQQRQGRSKH